MSTNQIFLYTKYSVTQPLSSETTEFDKSVERITKKTTWWNCESTWILVMSIFVSAVKVGKESRDSGKCSLMLYSDAFLFDWLI